jgi:sRNA-binding protein
VFQGNAGIDRDNYQMTTRRKQIDDIVALLCREFSKCFFIYERKRVPLKIGISHDLDAALDPSVDRKHLGLALQHYTHNIHYRRAQKAGSPRLDLDGNVTGHITELEAEHALRMIAGLKAAAGRQNPQAEPEIKPAAPPPPPPPPGDGLAALRAAAKRRMAVA